MTDRDLLDRKNELNKSRELLTTNEAAAFLRMSPTTLWRERRAGRIAFHRVAAKILFKRSDLETYLNRKRNEAFAVSAN